MLTYVLLTFQGGCDYSPASPLFPTPNGLLKKGFNIGIYAYVITDRPKPVDKQVTGK